MPPEPVPHTSAADWRTLKEAVKRFEQAWREGARPALDDSLPPNEPLRSRVRIELVHIELELRLKAGESARVEEYFGRYPGVLHERAVALELIAAEHKIRRRRESDLVLDEYLRRFPQYAADLPSEIAGLTVDERTPLASARDLNPAPPDVAGYEVLELLGCGGMGVVYRARQHSLDRPVALKILPERCAQDPIWLDRFRREARTASALNHPHICTIYDTGESAGRLFLSMELVEGQTLEALLRQRLTIEESVRSIAQAARALAAAHAAGIVHRDVKPANLMVRTDGILKVLDFGLAQRLSAAGPPSVAASEGDRETRVGTLLYMSPEQVRAESVGVATDIFSLGIVLYELVTGQHPFSAAADFGILNAIVASTPVSPSRLNPEISAPLEVLIQRMLAKESRFRPTAVEVEVALAQWTARVAGELPRARTGPPRAPTVGREHEWETLLAGFEHATAGRGSLLCVTGEPGLGKTTVIETFLDRLTGAAVDWCLARGRCSERLAGAEAYLPILDALDHLLAGDFGPSVAEAMKLLAPSWYVQLVPLAAMNPVFADAKASSQERRKRELGVFLAELSRQRPVVLFLDDVHWADPSSVDLLAYLSRKCPEQRLLILLSYRPSDLLRTEHPFGPIKLELQGRGICREIALPFLNRDDVDRYLTLSFADHRFPAELADLLQARTEGNPLFMADLLRSLRDRGAIVQEDGHWNLVRALPDLQRELPESVRGMIQRKIDLLTAADRHLLMAASVQGPEFDSAVVARLLQREPIDVEERLEILERIHNMVRLVREHSFPDGTLTLRYGFVHVLYQNALYAALQPTRKAAWSAAGAQALLDHHGAQSATLAAELAMLFEAARDHARAVDHYTTAAENAARVYAHREATDLARRGLALIGTLPETPDRARRELLLQMALGTQIQVMQGYAAPEAERIYLRACVLCDQVPEPRFLFRALWGHWCFLLVSAKFGKATELAERMFALAQTIDDPAHLLHARQALAITSFSLGDVTTTRTHMEQGAALYDIEQSGSLAYLFGQDPRAVSLSFGAHALWLLGSPDQAVERSREALTLCRKLGQPNTHGLCLYFDAVLRQYRREESEVRTSAEDVIAVSTEHGLSLWLAGGVVLRGWALAMAGESAPGIAQIREGLSAWAATGGTTHRTYHLALFAEALLEGGQIDDANHAVTEAMTLMEAKGEVFYGAELHRLGGELLLRQDRSAAAQRQAEECFDQAFAVARNQQARSLELRAAMSPARLRRSQGSQVRGLVRFWRNVRAIRRRTRHT